MRAKPPNPRPVAQRERKFDQMAREAAEPVPDEETAREIALEEAAHRDVPPGYLSDIRQFDREAERRRLGL